eukprot:TRINITY_DN11444_c0_g1_i1.p1 TRINITY_DN11444_c0_g1~~TRINITY_DN11444_c0_g1_i1.p1  ORF type:complete len:285 (+),score=54.79 TRINITY_DN11444_c0_g1_i1:34-888(+)
MSELLTEGSQEGSSTEVLVRQMHQLFGKVSELEERLETLATAVPSSAPQVALEAMIQDERECRMKEMGQLRQSLDELPASMAAALAQENLQSSGRHPGTDAGLSNTEQAFKMLVQQLRGEFSSMLRDSEQRLQMQAAQQLEMVEQSLELTGALQEWSRSRGPPPARAQVVAERDIEAALLAPPQAPPVHSMSSRSVSDLEFPTYTSARQACHKQRVPVVNPPAGHVVEGSLRSQSPGRPQFRLGARVGSRDSLSASKVANHRHSLRSLSMSSRNSLRQGWQTAR